MAWLARGRPPRAEARKPARSRLSSASYASTAAAISAISAVGVGPVARSGAAAVQPAGVGRGGDDLVTVEEVEQEGLVGGASVDDDGGLTQRGAQPGQCLASVAAPRDDLGDHRVVVGRDDVALGDAGVDAQIPEPSGNFSSRTVPGAGANSLSASSALSRASTAWPNSPGQSPSRDPAAGDEDLQLDQVDAGGDLGDRVLDLQPGVDLEEREDLLLRLVQVLDGARAAVSGGADEVGRHASARWSACSLVSTGELDSSITF